MSAVLKRQGCQRQPTDGEDSHLNQWKMACSTADEAPLTAPIVFRGDVCANLKRAARMGYDAIELHTRETVELDYDSIRRTTAECGAKVGMVITGRLFTEGKCNLMDDIPYVTEAAIVGLKKYVDMAALLEADLVIGWVKGNIPPGGPRRKYLDRLAGNLRIIADYGQQKNVRLNLEVINHYEVNVFTTCREIVTFLDTYAIDNCFIHLDTYHMNIEENDPYDAIRLAGKRLGYFHVADNSRQYPGSGQLNFQKTLNALEEAGYDGTISVECYPYPSEDEAAFKAIQFMKSIQKV